MADNVSAISNIKPQRGKRAAAPTEKPAPGKRASVKLAPAPTEGDSTPVEGEAGQAPAPVARAKRGPKPGSTRKPREAKPLNDTGAFDANAVRKGLKLQLQQLKAAQVEEAKEYKAKSKQLQADLTSVSNAMEKLDNAHSKATLSFTAGINKITAVLDSLA